MPWSDRHLKFELDNATSHLRKTEVVPRAIARANPQLCTSLLDARPWRELQTEPV